MEDLHVLAVPTPTKQKSTAKTTAAGIKAGETNGSSPPAAASRRRGRPTASHLPPRKSISVSTSWYPLLVQLKNELHLRSLADTVHWLIHRVRPDLLPTGPTPKPDKRSAPEASDPEPICMPILQAKARLLIQKRSIRATVVQAASLFFDTPGTLDKAERLIAIAAGYGSHLIVFPEAFVGGYPRCMPPVDSGAKDEELMLKYRSSAIEVPGPEFESLGKIAAKHRVYLVIGVVERSGKVLYSTMLFFDPAGRILGRQRKMFPSPSETAVWSSEGQCNSSLPLYQTIVGNVGGLICWDNIFPLLRNELYAKGIEIYCAPNADPGEMWRSAAVHIAVEGSCFVLSANQFCRRKDYPLAADQDGDINEIVCAGGSFIVSPSGTILSGPDHEGECLISADIDLKEIDGAKSKLMRINQTESNVDARAGSSHGS
ncbi:unnamed protein product [Linum trigynum]|uniref:CN hydrolase domain-containing protein n=1 Tax=Linum trigynum TaxID=586398 RepID=A0AAV2CXD8_9ROSI